MSANFRPQVANMVSEPQKTDIGGFWRPKWAQNGVLGRFMTTKWQKTRKTCQILAFQTANGRKFTQMGYEPRVNARGAGLLG